MARTLEEMDAELTRIRSDSDALPRASPHGVHPFRKLGGCFMGDEEREQIFAEIERIRRVPNPGYPGEARDVAA